MKTKSSAKRTPQGVQSSLLNPKTIQTLTVVTLVTLLPFWLIAAEQNTDGAKSGNGTIAANAGDAVGPAIVDFEPSDLADGEIAIRKNMPYLGVATDEASEALGAQ